MGRPVKINSEWSCNRRWISYLLFNKENSIQGSMLITSSNSNAKISKETLSIQKKYHTISAVSSFETDQVGIYTNTLTFDRRKWQYEHSVSLYVGYWINTKMPYVVLSYSYEWLLIAAQTGYSFQNKNIDYSIGIGTVFRF